MVQVLLREVTQDDMDATDLLCKLADLQASYAIASGTKKESQSELQSACQPLAM